MSEWYCQIDDKTIGPFSSNQLIELVRSHQLMAHHRVRKGADGKWFAAKSISGLFQQKPAKTKTVRRQITEEVLLWRPIGRKASWMPTRYTALCITTQRILLLDLGDAFTWTAGVAILGGLIGGVVGYFTGKGLARERADRLRRMNPDAMLSHAPQSEVITRDDLIDVQVRGVYVVIDTRRMGKRTFAFDKLWEAHSDELQSAVACFRKTHAPGNAAGKIALACTCGKTYRVASEHAGKRLKCPACRQEITVPFPKAASAPDEGSRSSNGSSDQGAPEVWDESRLARYRRASLSSFFFMLAFVNFFGAFAILSFLGRNRENVPAVVSTLQNFLALGTFATLLAAIICGALGLTRKNRYHRVAAFFGFFIPLPVATCMGCMMIGALILALLAPRVASMVERQACVNNLPPKL